MFCVHHGLACLVHTCAHSNDAWCTQLSEPLLLRIQMYLLLPTGSPVSVMAWNGALEWCPRNHVVVPILVLALLCKPTIYNYGILLLLCATAKLLMFYIFIILYQFQPSINFPDLLICLPEFIVLHLCCFVLNQIALLSAFIFQEYFSINYLKAIA